MKKYRDIWNGKLVNFIELAVDVILAVAILVFGAQLEKLILKNTFIPWEKIFSFSGEIVWQIIVYTIIAGTCFRVYKTSVIKRKFPKAILPIILSLFVSGFVAELLLILRGEEFILDLGVTPVLIFMCQVIIFALYKYFLYVIFFRFNRRTALIYGKKEDVLNFAKEFYLDNSNFSIVKYLIFEEEMDSLRDEFKEYIANVNDVYLTANIGHEKRDVLTSYILQKTYKELYFIPNTFEINIQKTSFDQIDDTLVFRTRSMHLSFEQRFLKRMFDLIFASLLLVIAIIPMIVVAIVIKIDDGGPVFFKQERIKRSNKKFNIIKFRTMKIDADREKLATKNDARITRVGKFLRATRLDELPQIFNILKGQMSIVGPRPLIPKVINETIVNHPDFAYRSNVKPGVTGFAQVSSRYDTEDVEKMRYDLAYVRNYSFWLDIKIILLTVGVVLSKDAASGLTEGEELTTILEKFNEEMVPIEEGYEIRRKG